SSYNNTVVTLKQSLKTRVGNRHNNKFGDKSTSRDANQVPALRNYIWKYMREHDGNKPNQREAFEAYLEIAKEASKITNKPVTPITELQATFKCTFKWSVSHYRAPDRKEGGEYSGAAFGRFIQSVRKGRLLVETLKLKQEGKKNNTEIAKELGVSRNSVIRYLSQNPEKTIIDVENFVKWYTEFVYDDYGAGCVLTNSGNDLMFSKYHDLYCLCKEVLLNYEYIKLFSSYSSYNNTVVTLTVSGTTTDLVDTSRTENIKHEMLKATTKEEEYLKYIENELNNQQNSIEEVPKSNVALSKSDQEWLKLMNKQYFKTA
ncbi:MAG: hypothetical protein HUJ56_05065, partial [Erysipelotrichaceae bacterium]|nr:hypothetical protein [Erysipelotrichaceae bacterium]